MERTSYEVPHYVVFSSLLLFLPTSLVHMYFSATCSQTLESVFFSHCQRSSFAPTQNKENYIFVYVNI